MVMRQPQPVIFPLGLTRLLGSFFEFFIKINEYHGAVAQRGDFPYDKAAFADAGEGIVILAEQVELADYFKLFQYHSPLLMRPLYGQFTFDSRSLLQEAFDFLPAYYDLGANINRYLRNQEWVVQFWSDFLKES